LRFGPYGDNGGLGRFYGDFWGDLAEPSVRAWALALGLLIGFSSLNPARAVVVSGAYFAVIETAGPEARLRLDRDQCNLARESRSRSFPRAASF